jgi:hypothetical protein
MSCVQCPNRDNLLVEAAALHSGWYPASNVASYKTSMQFFNNIFSSTCNKSNESLRSSQFNMNELHHVSICEWYNGCDAKLLGHVYTFM